MLSLNNCFIASHTNGKAAIPASASLGGSWADFRPKSVAAPPLHLPLVGCYLPPEPRPIHLPNLQQGILPAQLTEDPQPLAHGREAFQVPPYRLREGLQRPEQHEAARTRLPQLRKRQRRVGSALVISLITTALFPIERGHRAMDFEGFGWKEPRGLFRDFRGNTSRYGRSNHWRAGDLARRLRIGVLKTGMITTTLSPRSTVLLGSH
jgi:hypothetical protein